MVFNTTLLWVLELILFFWLIGVTFLLLKTIANYNRLTQGKSDKTLSEILTTFLDQDKLTRKELNEALAEVGKLRKETRRFVQKIGLIRFNPFSDTGGDQSFTLALLNGDDDGVLITSLYARSGVRWYVKTIRQGKGVEHELSKEEKEALRQATSGKVR